MEECEFGSPAVAALAMAGRQESTFYEGVKYMEFTGAVFRSVESASTVHLPLVDLPLQPSDTFTGSRLTLTAG